MRPAAAALAALAVLSASACTPVRSTLAPPYPLDGKVLSAEELDTYASERCAMDSAGAEPPPHRFTTDGCSAWPDDGWRSCCIKHDVAYWCGARPRLEADREFRDCVRAESSRANANLMFAGVRLGGGRFVPFPWRFGYGYPWPHSKPRQPGTAEPSEPRAQTPLTTR